MKWYVDGHNLAAVIRQTGTGYETVAICPNSNRDWRDDARLIAAAPKMRDALMGIADFAQMQIEDISAEYQQSPGSPWSKADQVAVTKWADVLMVLAEVERDAVMS